MIQLTEIQDPHNWAPSNLQNGDLFTSKKQVAGVVRLNSIDGHIYETEDREWFITADGYRECNKTANIQVIFPDTVMLSDGKIVGNPYIERDLKTNTPLLFIAKAISIGKNALGNPYISSSTIIFDALIAFVDDLSRAIAKSKDIGKFFMDGTLTDEEKRIGMYKFFDGDMGIYYLNDHPETLPIIQNFINNKRHGDKRVKTMAEKACLQRQPCMPPPKVRAINGYASVLVGNFRSDYSVNELNEIVREYTETGKVAGAEVVESSEDISKEVNSDPSSLNEGGPRF
jgi:hypothetical protein